MTTVTIKLDVPVRIRPVNKETDFVQLQLAKGAWLKVSAHDAIRAIVEPHLNGKSPEIVTTPKAIDVPAIGTEWNSGIYAGLTLDDIGPAALVLLPGDEKLKWDEAVTWAEKQGGTLPSRIDHLVLWKNLKDKFEEDWYWSSEPSAAGSAYAWFQSFYYGYQTNDHKANSHRARAVRRVPIYRRWG